MMNTIFDNNNNGHSPFQVSFLNSSKNTLAVNLALNIVGDNIPYINVFSDSNGCIRFSSKQNENLQQELKNEIDNLVEKYCVNPNVEKGELKSYLNQVAKYCYGNKKLQRYFERQQDTNESYLPTETQKKKLPTVLTMGLERIPNFILSTDVLYGRSYTNGRKMRSERVVCLRKVVSALMMTVCLQWDGHFCYIKNDSARLITNAEIAHLCGLNIVTVKRCLSDLKKMGYIESTQIKKKNSETMLQVSYAYKRFTPLFWQKLNLYDEFINACEKSKKNEVKRNLITPIKLVRKKTKKTYTHIGGVANKVLDDMLNEATCTTHKPGNEDTKHSSKRKQKHEENIVKNESYINVNTHEVQKTGAELNNKKVQNTEKEDTQNKGYVIRGWNEHKQKRDRERALNTT